MDGFFTALSQHAFLQTAVAAALLASIGCGVMGTYVVVKRMVSISGGVAVFPEDGMEIAELTEHADEALYLSKRGGRNRVKRYRGVQIGEAETDVDLGPATNELRLDTR